MPETFNLDLKNALLPNYQRMATLDEPEGQAVVLELEFDNHAPLQFVFTLFAARELIKGLTISLDALKESHP